MRKLSFLAVTAIVMMGIAFTSCDSGKSVSLKTDVDSVSYLIGSNWGYQMKNAPDIDFNVAAVIDGIKKASKGDSIFLGMDLQAASMYIQNYFQGAQIRAAEGTKAEADKFLAENKTKSGVITTESGLQYKVVTEGTGPKPVATDMVRVHYQLSSFDGVMIESSIDRGEPAEFPLNRVIPGWTEALQLMPVGSKYILWISPELGYGMNPPTPAIKPNAGLLFEVELLEIVKQ